MSDNVGQPAYYHGTTFAFDGCSIIFVLYAKGYTVTFKVKLLIMLTWFLINYIMTNELNAGVL